MDRAIHMAKIIESIVNLIDKQLQIAPPGFSAFLHCFYCSFGMVRDGEPFWDALWDLLKVQGVNVSALRESLLHVQAEAMEKSGNRDLCGVLTFSGLTKRIAENMHSVEEYDVNSVIDR